MGDRFAWTLRKIKGATGIGRFGYRSLKAHTYVIAACSGSGTDAHQTGGATMDKPQPTQRRPTLYLVYATPILGGSTIEDTVVAGDEDDAYRKARTLYPRDHYDVTVYLQSADDD
jgi:hypothetical protein